MDETASWPASRLEPWPWLLLGGGVALAIGPFLPWFRISVVGDFNYSRTHLGISVDRPWTWGVVSFGLAVAVIAALGLTVRRQTVQTILPLAALALSILVVPLLVRAHNRMHPFRISFPEGVAVGRIVIGFWFTVVVDGLVILTSISFPAARTRRGDRRRVPRTAGTPRA